MVKHRRLTELEVHGIEGNGIYCIYPYSSFKRGKGCYKIGIATGETFYNRCESVYHTYYPMGFYYKALLESPNKHRGKRTDIVYYKEIETYIYDTVVLNGGIAVKSNGRVNEGKKTEWVFTDQANIDFAFNEAKKCYGGIVHNQKLTKKDFDENEPTVSQSFFVGETRYFDPKQFEKK